MNNTSPPGGSFLGFSSRWILEVSSPWKAYVTAIDPNIRHRIFDRPRKCALQLNSDFIHRFKLHEAFFGKLVRAPYYYYCYENYEPIIEKEAVDELLDSRDIMDHNWSEKLDFIFIDGEHLYESVMSNFESAYHLLNPGGCIAFHDIFCLSDVTRAFNEISKNHPEAKVEIHGKALFQIKRVLRKLRMCKYGVDGIGVIRFQK